MGFELLNEPLSSKLPGGADAASLSILTGVFGDLISAATDSH